MTNTSLRDATRTTTLSTSDKGQPLSQLALISPTYLPISSGIT
ncbi:hypothetical protein [Nostoc sp. UCD121]|nr:hypothetical protein [Nostoc sp. UCD121]